MNQLRVLVLAALLGSPAMAAESATPPAKEAQPGEAARSEEEKKNWPKTLDAAVVRTLATMSEADKKAVRASPMADLIKFHDGLGATIRNVFGLWRGNRALIDDCNAKNPDEASMVILEEVWARLQREKK